MKRNYRNRGAWLPVILGVALFAVIAVWMISGVNEAARVSDSEGIKMAEDAIRRAAVSTYALDGAYPATYEDLKAQSGLQVDEDKYIIFYDIFASNIMPDITVVERRAEG